MNPAVALDSLVSGKDLLTIEARQKEPAAEQTWLKPVLWLLLAICIGRLWLMPLQSSFWVDEMATVFVVHTGGADPTLRDAPQVADSIYYVLPALAEKLAGLSEFTYRLFSLLAMGAALWTIAQLAAILVDPRATWFVVFACLASKSFNYQAADARPYALGTMILCFALLSLVRWLNNGSWFYAFGFAVCAAMLWWVHLVFWPFYLIFVLYGAYRLVMREHNATPVQLGLVTIVVIGCCVPVGLRALALLHGASAHVVVDPPPFGELIRELKLGMITGACTVVALMNRWRGWDAGVRRFSRGALVLILAWWALDPLVIFFFSKITGNSLWVPRYMYLALPGVAFMACLMTGLFLPARLWKLTAVWLACGVLLFTGQWNRLWPAHQRSDWRTASGELRGWVGGQDVPVICPSPFVEARSPAWTPQYPVSGFFYSHLAVYPMAGRVYPFPFEPSREASTFGRQLLGESLLKAGRFAIYGGDHNVAYWRQWFAAQPELHSWKSKVVALHGDVEIVGFSAP